MGGLAHMVRFLGPNILRESLNYLKLVGGLRKLSSPSHQRIQVDIKCQ